MPVEAIRQSTHPYLQLHSASTPIEWSYGDMLRRLRGSTTVRITQRGVSLQMQYRESPWVAQLENWESMDCYKVDHALCGIEDKLLWFPDPVIGVDVPDDLSSIVDTKYTYECTFEHSGRSLTPGDSRYEVSLCDLLDNKLDVLYVPAQDKIYFTHEPEIKVFFDVLLAVISIYFVSCIAQNLLDVYRNMSRSDKRPINTQLQTYAIYLCLIVVGVMLLLNAFSWHLIIYMWTDFLLAWLLFAFVLVEALYKHSSKALTDESEQISNINCIIGCLLLTSMLLHNTFDNPYVLALTATFTTRAYYKYFIFIKKQVADNGTKLNSWAPAIVILNLALSFILLQFTVVPGANNALESIVTSCYVHVGALLFAIVLDLLHLETQD